MNKHYETQISRARILCIYFFENMRIFMHEKIEKYAIIIENMHENMHKNRVRLIT